MGFLCWYRALVARVCNLIAGPRSGGTTSLPSYLVEAEESAPETHSSEQFFGSSTSSEAFLSSQPAHEIFLSHSGRQKAFVEQLYKDFESEGQYPFFDVTSHSLPKGEKFPPRVFKAARECKVAVIILTEDFLTTKWPMMELITFVDAQKTINPRLKLLPVLYNRLSFEDLQVDRWKKEWIKLENLSSHGRDLSNILTLKKCAEALKTLRKVNALKDYKSDVELRMAIVKDTIKLLPEKPDTDMKEIQGADRLCEVLSKMFQYSADHSNKVQYLGLYGMGGLGKTTMCKALCKHFLSEFDSKVYHVELEFAGYDPERARKQLNRQKILLRKLTALSEHAAENIQEPSAAKDCLKERLKLIPVFLAVDNVQDEEPSRQEARDYLECISCPGRKVLITSRSHDIVNRVLDDKTCCNLIPFMNEEEAMKLFLKTSRLGVSSVNPEITQILRECLEYCRFPFEEGANSTLKDNDSGHFHPLALRAAACFLQDIPESKWKEKLHRPSLLHHSRESKEIYRILGLGFDSLCDDGKQLFFDIALRTPPFLDADKIFEWLVNIHGKPRNLVDTKLRDLRRKAFLDYRDTGPKTMISMHDLYKEFAKYLANNQHRKFGIYLEDPSVIDASNWSAVPRVSLLRCKVYLPEVQPWSSVVMVHLVQCENVYNFSIGHLYNLRHLMILECSKLELLSWTPQTVDKGGDQPVPDLLRRGWGMELRFVELLYNRFLKGLPDFSPCSKLQTILVKGCCPSVEPMTFRSCSSLEKLRFLGENTPHVELIQSCPKLVTAQFAWRNSYGRMPELRDLPLLTELVLNGPSKAFKQKFYSMPSKTIQECFLQQYSKELEDHNLPGIYLGLLTNLEKLDLNYMPLGKLPEPAQSKILKVLNLKGSLLSQLVDFSTLSSLRELIIAWTNVEEVRGIDHLLELELFDCEFCFQLMKIPHLDRLQKLKFFSVFCCNELRAIPRLPQQYLGGVPQRKFRIMHGALSVLTIPRLPEMGVFLDHTSKSIHGRFQFSASQLAKVHASIVCSGCNQSPLIGPRFKLAKNIQGNYLDICNLCCTKKCDRSVACQESGRIRRGGLRWVINYDLCLNCFEKFGCNLDDFRCIHQTLSDTSDARVITKSRSARLDFMAKYASLAESSDPEYSLSSSLQKILLRTGHYHSII